MIVSRRCRYGDGDGLNIDRADDAGRRDATCRRWRYGVGEDLNRDLVHGVGDHDPTGAGAMASARISPPLPAANEPLAMGVGVYRHDRRYREGDSVFPRA
ncbi:hypothetical protein AB0M79_28170 [Polymorphospora sp. NPDC051019]|uniref:hypothetical protein n=1 Tax=unclassified Polymorphospora TaxID=2685497 RepID=UPI0033C49C39